MSFDKKLVTVSNLTIRFSKVEKEDFIAVNNLSFVLKKGECLGIVGESGSGKSLTALAVIQLLPQAAHQQGQVVWQEGDDLAALPESQMRAYRGQKIGMIFQEPLSSLNPVFTCGDQVGEVLQTHFNLNKKEARIQTEAWFTKVQLADPTRIFNAYPHQISGGQRQRVMIAMALCAQPDLLICDEPTTALDVTVQHTILELLIKLRKKTGISIIFISHDLAVVKRIADRVLVLQNGIVEEEGQVETVFNTPNKPYTQGLLACRPPLNKRLKRLPVITDFKQLNKAERFLFFQSLEETIVAYNTRQKELAGATTVLNIDNLRVRFVKDRNWLGKPIAYVDAVNQVSLNLRKGETIGLVGESGSGKTTLGKAILRLVKTESGQITFLGKSILNLEEETLRTLRPKMQMVFQDPYNSLNPKTKIGEMLTEPLSVHFSTLSKEEKQIRVVEMIEKVGLDKDSLERYASEFSGGQRQRIGLARALLLQPELLICDESVSALDVSVQAQVLNLIKDLKEVYQFSLIFITHDLSVVKFIADTICVMKDGVIVEKGDAESIFNSPKHPYTQKLLGAILE